MTLQQNYNAKRVRQTFTTSSGRQLPRSASREKFIIRPTAISQAMSLHSEICWEGCPANRRQGSKSGRRISGHLPTLIFIVYGLLKMSSGSTVPDQDPELINAQKLQISPNYSPKEICSYIDLHPSQNPFQLHNGCQHEVSHFTMPKFKFMLKC